MDPLLPTLHAEAFLGDARRILKSDRPSYAIANLEAAKLFIEESLRILREASDDY